MNIYDIIVKYDVYLIHVQKNLLIEQNMMSEYKYNQLKKILKLTSFHIKVLSTPMKKVKC